MKKAFIALAFVSSSAIALEPSWVAIAEDSEGGGVLIDVANVKISGDIVLAWYTIKLPPAMRREGAVRHVTRMKVDCAAERTATMSLTAYGKDGRSISSQQIPYDEWKDVAPGSIGRDMMEAACLLKKPKDK